MQILLVKLFFNQKIIYKSCTYLRYPTALASKIGLIQVWLVDTILDQPNPCIRAKRIGFRFHQNLTRNISHLILEYLKSR